MDSAAILYGVAFVVLAWILWGGGARLLARMFASGCLISWLAPTWNEGEIKFWSFLVLLISTAWFLYQLFGSSAL